MSQLIPTLGVVFANVKLFAEMESENQLLSNQLLAENNEQQERIAAIECNYQKQLAILESEYQLKRETGLGDGDVLGLEQAKREYEQGKELAKKLRDTEIASLTTQ